MREGGRVKKATQQQGIGVRSALAFLRAHSAGMGQTSAVDPTYTEMLVLNRVAWHQVRFHQRSHHGGSGVAPSHVHFDCAATPPIIICHCIVEIQDVLSVQQAEPHVVPFVPWAWGAGLEAGAGELPALPPGYNLERQGVGWVVLSKDVNIHLVHCPSDGLGGGGLKHRRKGLMGPACKWAGAGSGAFLPLW